MDLFSRKNMILLREMIKTDLPSMVHFETFTFVYDYVFSFCAIFKIR